jgi:predicted phosphodiesterase
MSDNIAKIYQALAKDVKLSNNSKSKRNHDVKLSNADTRDATVHLAVSYVDEFLDDAKLQVLTKAGVLLNKGAPVRITLGAKRPFALGIAWVKLEKAVKAETEAAEAAAAAAAATAAQAEAQAQTDAQLLMSTDAAGSVNAGKVPAAKVTLLENRIRNLEKELKDAKDASAVDVALVNLLETVGQHYQKGKIKPPPAPSARQRKSDSHEGVAALVLSDWHWGERVNKDCVNGLNEYNAVIADRRASRVFDKSLVMLDPTPGKYDALVLPFLGDMLSGVIHEELVATNDGSVLDSLLSLLTKLESGLVTYAQHFPMVQVVATYGNHGRMDRRKTHKAQSSLNYETLVFRLLERNLKARMGDSCNVHFKIATASDVTVQVYDKTYLLTHGDQFDSNPGNTLERVRAGDAAKRKRAHDAKQPVHDVLICGHYHQYQAVGNIITNGSLVGYNEYAYHSNLTIERPQQALFVQHPSLGITRHSAVFADEPTTATSGVAPVSLELAY